LQNPAELIRKTRQNQVFIKSVYIVVISILFMLALVMRDVSELKLFQTRLETSNARVLNQLLVANSSAKYG